MLLILSKPDDPHVPMVASKLQQRGLDYLWFDPARYPAEAGLSLGFDSSGTTQCLLDVDGRVCDLSGVSAVWNRRPGKPQAGTSVADPTHRSFVELVGERCMTGVWEILDCRWLPARPATDMRARNKVLQLAVAAKLGFLLPDTLITNRPEDFLAFHSRSDAPLVSKSLAPFNVQRDGAAHVVSYTRPVSRRDVHGYRAVRHAPVIFQAYVPKLVELRVTIVGRQVFAVEIASQESRATRHDWRHVDDESVRYSPHQLPDEIAVRCFRLMEKLGLTYGAIDLILTPAGDYVFLEINPNGQWAWIEDLTGAPIAESIANFLAGQGAAHDDATGAG